MIKQIKKIKMFFSYTNIINFIYLNEKLIEIYTQWKKLYTKM